MKKILFVINSLSNGGAERALVNLVNHLPQDKFQITLFSLYSSGIYDALLNKNIKYKYLFKEKGSAIRRLKLIILCRIIPRAWLHKLIFKEKYDYEVAFLQGFPTELVRHSSNKKSEKIAFIHSDFKDNYDVKKLYCSCQVCFKAYQQFGKVCFVSKTVQEGFEQTIGKLEHGYVVHNVIDSANIIKQAQEKCELFYKDDAIRLVAVGRLIKLKAFDRIIEIVDKLRSNFKIECWIIGDGVEKENLQRLINEKSLEEEIKLIGYQKNPYKYMKNADIYIHSSTTEGYSTSVVEAILLGLPVITTDVSGMKEIIGDSNAGLIVENSCEGLYNGVRSVLQSRNTIKEMRCSAKERSVSFSTENQVKEFLGIL